MSCRPVISATPTWPTDWPRGVTSWSPSIRTAASRRAGAWPAMAGSTWRAGMLSCATFSRLGEGRPNPATSPSTLRVDLFGQIDFNNVGMMGHSRGGEGIRAAYNQYRDGAADPITAAIPVPVNFRALFEIGPVDGQTGRVLNPPGVVW